MSLQNPLDTELARRGGVNGLIAQIKKVLTFYFPKPTGKSTDYIRGDGSIAPFPTVSGSTYNPTAGTGISITGTSPNQTITNTLPDQTVALTAGTGIGVAGTYPNFTISNTSPSSGGTVTSIDVDAGTGISVSPAGPITTSGTFTVTNTAPDQIVALTAGTGIGITGSYPNFTITNSSPSSGGTVTAVTASAPMASTGGTAPNLSMPQSGAAQDGYLSSTDWNTFNNKQNALTLTTTGTSGAATLVGSTLNIPQYSSGGGGAVGGVHCQIPINSNAFYFLGLTSLNPGNNFIFSNTLYLYPFYPVRNVTIISFLMNVNTASAGALGRILIYSNTNGLPVTKLYESTDINLATTGTKTMLLTNTFNANTIYWLAFYSNSGSVAMTTYNSASMTPIAGARALTDTSISTFTFSATFGSAPNTISSGALSNLGGSPPAIYLRNQ